VFAGIVILLAVATAIGMAVLWPGDTPSGVGESIVVDSEAATVERVNQFSCQSLGTDTCGKVTVRLDSGPDEGRKTSFQIGVGGLDPDVDVGDKVRVVENAVAPGVESVRGQEYSLTDFERRRPMLLLALLFGGLVVILARLRGILSLVGLGVSLAVVLVFMVPAILDGKSPLAVAVVGSFAVMLTTIALAHGTGAKSLAAMIGTALSLVLTIALAVLFVDLTHLTGLSSEESLFLQTSETGLSLDGLLLAGMVVAALGVLDDVTISQSSTVLALRGANPRQGFRELFGRAMSVGRDHVSATVNTLVLAYVGASLPLLLIFSSSTLSFSDAVNLELIAKEVVATLVGSIGLITAVPITTALAAVLARRIPHEQLAGEQHAGHSH
jgi:uncharacterized membrane protein